MEQGGQLFILSGPSGSGKTSVVQHLLGTLPDLMFSISYTTRTPRAGEQDGREYHFVSREKFEAMIVRGDFLEYASVFGDLYGTHRDLLGKAEGQGKDVLLDIDVEGTRRVKARVPEAVAILILPPSWQELERRLQARGLDNPQMVRRRLERARQEIENYALYDFVVINRLLADTCAQVEAIVASERQRRSGQRPDTAAQQVAARAAAARTESNHSQVSAILETFGAPIP